MSAYLLHVTRELEHCLVQSKTYELQLLVKREWMSKIISGLNARLPKVLHDEKAKKEYFKLAEILDRERIQMRALLNEAALVIHQTQMLQLAQVAAVRMAAT